MPHPFPGMNPWLEDSRYWRGIHQRLITSIGDAIAPELAPRYFVDVETHTYVSREGAPTRSRFPDVAILDTGGTATLVAPSMAAVAELDEAVDNEMEPYTVDLPRESFEEAFLIVRLVSTNEIVTVIELLSHTNKRRGADRQSYLEKRRAYFESIVNIVEIDFLRANEPMPLTETAHDQPAGDYRILLRYRDEPGVVHVWQIGVQQRIPKFRVPLLPPDLGPYLDLGALLQQIYDRAQYRLVVDYTQPPVPPLSNAVAAWAAEQIAVVKQNS